MVKQYSNNSIKNKHQFILMELNLIIQIFHPYVKNIIILLAKGQKTNIAAL